MERLIILLLLLPTVIGANYPLEIIRPADDIGDDRIHKAYPGIEYKIRAAVIGGMYPIEYGLLDAPTGMRIDDEGYITWTDPDSNTTPITLTVTDSEGTTISSQWSIEVTTDSFHFVDADANEGGDGTLESPWNGWEDFYLGLEDDTYSGDTIYFMDGTYTYIPEFTTRTTGSSNQFEIKENHPKVFMAYPGENNVFFDGERETEQIHIIADEHNQYFQGINFIRGYGYGIQKNIGNYMVVLDCSFSDFQDSGSASNQAGVLFRFDAPRNDNSVPESDQGFALNNVIQGCSFNDIASSGIETYGTRNLLIEDNEFSDIDKHSMLIKSTSDRTFIRNNRIHGTTSLLSQYYVSNTDISFNHLRNDGMALQVGGYDGTAGPELTYIYRNTIEGEIWFRAIDTDDDGPIYIYNNVIVNDNPEDHIRDEVGEHYSITMDRAVIGDNLLGSPSDNILNNGRLTEPYAEHLGTHGWELSYCIHTADNNPCDGTISASEFLNFILSWISGEADMQDILEAIVIWKA